MASADFLRFSPPLLAGLSYIATYRKTSPGKHVFRPPINRHIYCKDFVQCWDFAFYCRLIHPRQPHMWFLFVGTGFRYGLPSDSASRRTPLTLARGSYCQVRRGLPPPGNSKSGLNRTPKSSDMYAGHTNVGGGGAPLEFQAPG